MLDRGSIPRRGVIFDRLAFLVFYVSELPFQSNRTILKSATLIGPRCLNHMPVGCRGDVAYDGN